MNSIAFIFCIPSLISTKSVPVRVGLLYNSHIGAGSERTFVVNGFIFTKLFDPFPAKINTIDTSINKPTNSPVVQLPLKYKSTSGTSVDEVTLYKGDV